MRLEYASVLGVHVRGGVLIDRIPAAVALLAIATFALLAYAHGQSVDCFPALNDFWGNAFTANFWNWTPRRAWNGFYPPGYPLLLLALPGDSVICSAYNANVLAGTALLAAVWVGLRTLGAGTWALLGLLLVAVNPVVVTQMLSSGPDAWFVVLTVVGALAVFHASEIHPSIGVASLGGLCLGCAGLLRYHAFPWSGAVLVAAAVVRWRGRVLGAAAIPVLASGLGLVTLGLAAGDLGALQRDQAFNLFTHLVEPPNWFHLPPANTLPGNLWEAIARNPPVFWRNYLAFAAPHVWLLAAPAVAWLTGEGVARRFALFTLVTLAIFVPIVDLGASPRGVACAIPVVLVAISLAIAHIVRRMASAAWRPFVALALVTGCAVFVVRAWLPEVRDIVSDIRHRAATSGAVEAELRADHVKFAAQVFSTEAFYFLGASGWENVSYHPWMIGGWPSFDLDGYRTLFTVPSTDTLDGFLDDCQRLGITHLTLGPAASLVQAELGEIFDGRRGTPRLRELSGVAGLRLFRIVE